MKKNLQNYKICLKEVKEQRNRHRKYNAHYSTQLGDY